MSQRMYVITIWYFGRATILRSEMYLSTCHPIGRTPLPTSINSSPQSSCQVRDFFALVKSDTPPQIACFQKIRHRRTELMYVHCYHRGLWMRYYTAVSKSSLPTLSDQLHTLVNIKLPTETTSTQRYIACPFPEFIKLHILTTTSRSLGYLVRTRIQCLPTVLSYLCKRQVRFYSNT